jgi:hypothetical protein
MGNAASSANKDAVAAAAAKKDTSFAPPLGAPNPVRARAQPRLNVCVLGPPGEGLRGRGGRKAAAGRGDGASGRALSPRDEPGPPRCALSAPHPRRPCSCARAQTDALGPSTPHPQENPLVFFDIQLGRYGDATPLGRIVMELKARRGFILLFGGWGGVRAPLGKGAVLGMRAAAVGNRPPA